MDQLSADDTGNNRKSLVISRLELFEQINSINDVHTTTVNKPVSRSNSNVGDVDDRSRTVNVVHSTKSVNVNSETDTDTDRSSYRPINESEDGGDFLSRVQCLQIGGRPSSQPPLPCSKRISYNMAVNLGELSKVAIDRRKDVVIDESDNEVEASPNRNVDVVDDTTTTMMIDKIDGEENRVDSTTATPADSGTVSVALPVAIAITVDDINIEDLNSTNLTNDILSSSVITRSSSRIADELKSCAVDDDDDDDVDYPQELNPFEEQHRTQDAKINNPFGSDDDDGETDCSTNRNKSSTLKKVDNTNPFWSGTDDEDEASWDDKSVKKTPVPLPRSVKKAAAASITPQPSPKPRIKSTINVNVNDVDECSSANVPSPSQSPSPSPSRRSLQTMSGGAGAGDSSDVSFLRSPSQSVNSTLRKKKPPPPPPPAALAKSPNNNIDSANGVQIEEKTNRINVAVADAAGPTCPKAVVSPWKNRKGPAPARPIPIRRPVKEMPLEDIKTELCDIQVRQQELDRQAKRLEQMIREQNALNFDSNNVQDTSASSNEELVLQHFELVNEKNELLRRHSELMYMRKMHSLEKDHADIEYQLRCLMLQPESNKTDFDKSQEEQLLKRLLEVVEKRNEIIEAMEKDRLRETAEDKSVTTQLDVNECRREDESTNKKSKKKKDKTLKDGKEDGGGTSAKHSPSKVIKHKFMTLRHSTKKLNSKIPH